MTRPTQTAREDAVVRAFLSARGEIDVETRAGAPGTEPDVIATCASGSLFRVEVGRIMDRETMEREVLALRRLLRLTDALREAVAAAKLDLPGVFVGAWYDEEQRPPKDSDVIDAVLAFLKTGKRPTDPEEVFPRPGGLSHLDVKVFPHGTYVHVPSAGAFSPGLGSLYDEKRDKSYAGDGDVDLLAIVPHEQSWIGGGGALGSAVARLRERLRDNPAPFREIVVLDETSGAILATIPQR